jgi:transcription elongation factor Elf1
MASSELRDCPTRPECPVCGMAMITLERIEYNNGMDSCKFECLRCGHVEVSQPARAGHVASGPFVPI